MAFSFNIVITEKWTQNRSHLLYKQRINYEKFLDVPPVPYEKTVSFVNLKHSTMATYPCVICKIHVRLRQQALECDGCFQWQHRLCNFFYEQQLTRYQRQTYRKAHGSLTTLRDRYEEKTLRTSEFLHDVGNLFALSVSRTAASWLRLNLSKIMC